MTIYENIPESAKLTTAIGPAALSLFGVPLEQWVLVLSAIVSILIILEKIPKAIDSLKNLKRRFSSGNRKE